MRWLGLLLFAFRLSKTHLDCTGTVRSPCNLKFYFLTFSKGIIVYPLKLAAGEEEVFSLLCPYKPETTVCD
jgi:hypothetical protein